MRSAAFALIGLASAQRKQRSDPVYSCPNGYELVGKTCRRQTSQPAQMVCTQGTMRNGVCVKPGQKDQGSCPPGTTQVGGSCQSKDLVSPTSTCPAGTHDIGGHCATYSVTGIVETCNQGTLEGGECALYEPVAPLVGVTCPAGYTSQKGSCWKSVQMDCTPPQQGKRMLQQQGKGPHFTVAPTEAPKYVPAPSKLAVKQKQCEIKLEANPLNSTSCPQGAISYNGGCAIRTSEPAVVVCSLGADPMCFPHTTVPGTIVCPSGFKLEGDMCSKTNTTPKYFGCATGVMENNQCVITLGAPTPKCPAGKTPSGNMCLGFETTQPILSVTITCQGKNCA